MRAALGPRVRALLTRHPNFSAQKPPRNGHSACTVPLPVERKCPGAGKTAHADGSEAGTGDGTNQGRQHELKNKPEDSHVARTDQDKFGEIFRRNMPYGNVENHGTVFVGFSAEQQRLSKILESMAGLANGTRDTLTRYTQPLTGAYYFVPSVESLRALRWVRNGQALLCD